MLIELHLPTLKALANVAAVSDVRTYLIGVQVETGPHGTIYVATDGHQLLATKRPETCAESFAFIIPLDQIKALKPFHKSTEMLVCELGEQKEQARELTITDGRGAIKFTSIDARFPDWRRIVASITPGPIVAASYNPQLLRKLQLAAQAMMSKNATAMVNVRQAGDSGALVDVGLGGDWIGVIMPWRTPDLELITAPEWSTVAPSEPAHLKIAA